MGSTFEWHSLALSFDRAAISASIDGKIVAQVKDASHKNEMAGIGSGWNVASFDNFAV